MKKFILTLLLSIFIIPSVSADCINLYEATPGNLYKETSGSWTYLYSSTNASSYYNIQLESGKKYTFFATSNGEIVDNILLSNTYSMSIYGTTYINGQITSSRTFTANSNKFIFNYNFNSTPKEDEINTYQSWQYWLVEGTTTCVPVTEEPEPEIPEEDDPVIIPDSTLDDFYSIYTSKLSLISNYALENKFILGAIAIILLFIILEIILKLFRGGGYK